MRSKGLPAYPYTHSHSLWARSTAVTGLTTPWLCTTIHSTTSQAECSRCSHQNQRPEVSTECDVATVDMTSDTSTVIMDTCYYTLERPRTSMTSMQSQSACMSDHRPARKCQRIQIRPSKTSVLPVVLPKNRDGVFIFLNYFCFQLCILFPELHAIKS